MRVPSDVSVYTRHQMVRTYDRGGGLRTRSYFVHLSDEQLDRAIATLAYDYDVNRSKEFVGENFIPAVRFARVGGNNTEMQLLARRNAMNSCPFVQDFLLQNVMISKETYRFHVRWQGDQMNSIDGLLLLSEIDAAMELAHKLAPASHDVIVLLSAAEIDQYKEVLHSRMLEISEMRNSYDQQLDDELYASLLITESLLRCARGGQAISMHVEWLWKRGYHIDAIVLSLFSSIQLEPKRQAHMIGDMRQILREIAAERIRVRRGRGENWLANPFDDALVYSYQSHLVDRYYLLHSFYVWTVDARSGRGDVYHKGLSRLAVLHLMYREPGVVTEYTIDCMRRDVMAAFRIETRGPNASCLSLSSSVLHVATLAFTRLLFDVMKLLPIVREVVHTNNFNASGSVMPRYGFSFILLTKFNEIALCYGDSPVDYKSALQASHDEVFAHLWSSVPNTEKACEREMRSTITIGKYVVSAWFGNDADVDPNNLYYELLVDMSQEEMAVTTRSLFAPGMDYSQESVVQKDGVLAKCAHLKGLFSSSELMSVIKNMEGGKVQSYSQSSSALLSSFDGYFTEMSFSDVDKPTSTSRLKKASLPPMPEYFAAFGDPVSDSEMTSQSPKPDYPSTSKRSLGVANEDNKRKNKAEDQTVNVADMSDQEEAASLSPRTYVVAEFPLRSPWDSYGKTAGGMCSFVGAAGGAKEDKKKKKKEEDNRMTKDKKKGKKKAQKDTSTEQIATTSASQRPLELGGCGHLIYSTFAVQRRTSRGVTPIEASLPKEDSDSSDNA